jgi:hypothetical protein
MLALIAFYFETTLWCNDTEKIGEKGREIKDIDIVVRPRNSKTKDLLKSERYHVQLSTPPL